MSYIPQGFSGQGSWKDQKKELNSLGVNDAYIAKMGPGDYGMVMGNKAVTGNADVGPSRIVWDGGKFVDNSSNYSAWKDSKPKSTASTGLLPTGGAAGSASGGAATSSTTTGSTMANTSTGGLLTQPSSFSFNATSANTQVDPVTREVKAEELASNQLASLLSKESPLSQRATTSGMQYGNSRGLLNSSIAGEASYGAWVDRATPIAMDDAGKYTNVEDRNMDAKNEFGLADKKFGFDLTLQKNDLGWKSGENALDRTLTRTENAADRALTKSEGAANRSNNITIQEMSDTAAMNRLNVGNAFTAGENALNREATASENQAQRDFTAGENQLTRDSAAALQDDAQAFTASESDKAFANRLTEIDALADKDAEARLDNHLNELEKMGVAFGYDLQRLPLETAANFAGNFSTNVAAILADPNLDPAAKDQAIKNLEGVANDTFAFYSTLFDTNLPEFGTPSSKSVANKEYSGEIFDPVAAPPTGRNQAYT